MKAWGNLPSSLRRENTENAVANATRVHPWDVKNKTGSRVQTIPRDIPTSTDVPVLLLNHSIFSPAGKDLPKVTKDSSLLNNNSLSKGTKLVSVGM